MNKRAKDELLLGASIWITMCLLVVIIGEFFLNWLIIPVIIVGLIVLGFGLSEINRRHDENE